MQFEQFQIPQKQHWIAMFFLLPYSYPQRGQLFNLQGNLALLIVSKKTAELFGKYDLHN